MTGIYLVIVFFLSAIQSVAADQTLSRQILLLDNEYQQLAEEIYSAKADQQDKADNIESLLSQYTARLSANQRAQASRLLVANRELVTENPAHPLCIDLIETLLDDNERWLAGTIYGLVENSSDATNLPYLDYAFAKYHARHRQWQEVSSILQTIPLELSGDDADYAYLLQGIARQYMKQHRMSIKSYDNIAETSPFYLHARLNTALANLRQGWTTEAQLIMTSLVPVSRKRQNSEFTNRIYLVMGYALLQKEFFRDARNAFGNVASNTDYSGQALIGIALSAISQRDFAGALNAVNVLKAQNSEHISRDEAFLLTPYIHQRLGNTNEIEDSFSKAIDHFKFRLQQLQLNKSQAVDPEALDLAAPGGLEFDGFNGGFSKHYPQFLIANRNKLEQLAEELRTESFFTRIDSLQKKHDNLINRLVMELIDRQRDILNSYLDQARYGLARHIDELAGSLE